MRVLVTLYVLIVTVVAACAPAQSPGEEDGVVVPEGKEDNFFSFRAQEYMVEGTSTVTLEDQLRTASEDQKLARAKELVGLKHVAISWFLNEYLMKQGSHASNGGSGGLVKDGAYEDLGIAAEGPLTYRFTFRQQFAGGNDLLRRLPTTTGADGRLYLDLVIGRPSNAEMAQLETNREWYRQSPWSGFDPARLSDSQLEKLSLAVWRQPASTDAWIDYNRLFADGKVTIATHFGWDYNGELHVTHPKIIYDWLIGRHGFTSPVASFDEYTRHSGPLVKTLQANGRSVTVEVSIYWPREGTDVDPSTDAGGRALEDDLRRSFKEKEVIIFSGHSGPFYGFALANWRVTNEGDLDDSEIAALDLPADSYQIVVAEGCDTYALGQGFRLNPAKAGGRNIDVVTTTATSNGSGPGTVLASLEAIIRSERGQHSPMIYGDFLRQLDSVAPQFNTMYGVHGIDDNPHSHPYANPEALCRSCKWDEDCGGLGNKCTRLPNSQKFCSYMCSANDGCPDGYRCVPVASGGYIGSLQCAPVTLSCAAL